VIAEDPLFRKVLVANRGEIALRVMRACRDLGIASVAVYGPGEIDAPHVRYADEAYRIPSEQPIPYLDIDALISVAKESGAEAVHPGYGFLAENAGFARACLEAGIIFVGPPPGAIAAMGDKVKARAVAERAGVPIVPGSAGAVDIAGAQSFAAAYGYPIALKASAGGGGRGFRVAWQESEIEDAYRGASGEAQRYFGDPTVYVERYLDHPRHIEIQVFADSQGHYVSLGERDCSIQRRHQKLIEESPSPAITPEIRKQMGDTACRLAAAVDYLGAGTVEFLFQDGDFYFLEMNTRIQVEHPVTEEITGVDLVAEQLRVAASLPLSFDADIAFRSRGHAIECRINAEDPVHDFRPTPGTISEYRAPAGPGIRVDGAAELGYEILQTYDSLIAKLITWGKDREQALARMRRALSDYQVSGVATSLGFHRAVLADGSFQEGDFDTRFLERHADILDSLSTGASTPLPDSASNEPFVSEDYRVEVNGKRFDVKLYTSEPLVTLSKPANTRRPGGRPQQASARGPAHGRTPLSDGAAAITSPIQGTILSVAVELGQTVKAGDLICVVEAMKMENEITATHDGVIRDLRVAPGETVRIGAPLAVIGEAEQAV